MRDRLPPWFKKRMPAPETMSDMKKILDSLHLHTICESAICPNIGDCFKKKTATFLMLGDTCTRNCTFCAVKKGVPLPVDKDEPEHLTDAVRQLGLKHVVITSVTRDDLADGGAGHFAETIRQLQADNPALTIEVLVPDFAGNPEATKTLVESHPDIINHNLETVPRLYHEVRPMANYKRSLELLRLVKELDNSIITKTGLMVGLGEDGEEIYRVMDDLREIDCDLLTIGQYLAPSTRHHPVVRYVTPEEFGEYERIGMEKGFRGVASSPLVRSSFDAASLYANAMKEVGPENG